MRISADVLSGLIVTRVGLRALKSLYFLRDPGRFSTRDRTAKAIEAGRANRFNVGIPRGFAMSQRGAQFVMVVGLLGVSWPLMMLVHESGHMTAAWVTGGRVQRLIWYPLCFSRTDVMPNPSPLVVVWAGPVVGAVVPAVVAALGAAGRLSISYILSFFAGFCLLANGAYIGVGTFERVGDARDMLRLGASPVSMVLFGLFATMLGVWLLNRVSPQLGFGRNPKPIRKDHAFALLGLAAAICVIGFLLGNRGG
jgi:hypothetical protein